MIPISSLLNPQEEARANSETDTQPNIETTSAVSSGNLEQALDTNEESQDAAVNVNFVSHYTAMPDPSAEPKPKKKKKKSKGKAKPTGFEDYYVDVPITPEEFKEENDLYHPSRTFAERIETCIQRYQSRRKFDSERKNIFDKWMAYGGIDSGQKMFSGGLDTNTEDPEMIAFMKATNYVGGKQQTANKKGSSYMVDFEGVVKSFLGSEVPLRFDLTTLKANQACVSIIRNFLNYVLYHNVCPEFTEQVEAARTICDTADKELFAVKEASSRLPGQFNIACSTFFGGYYWGLHTGNQEWAQDSAGDSSVGMDDRRAEKVIKAALGAYGDQRVLHAKNSLALVSSTPLTFEIIELVYPNENTKRYYTHQIKSLMTGDFKALGKVKARRWSNLDLPDDVSDCDDDGETTKTEYEFELWIEEELLEICFVGMKVEAVVRLLNCGIHYFDTITVVHPSFFNPVANDWLGDWVEPRDYKPAEAEWRQGLDQRKTPDSAKTETDMDELEVDMP